MIRCIVVAAEEGRVGVGEEAHLRAVNGETAASARGCSRGTRLVSIADGQPHARRPRKRLQPTVPPREGSARRLRGEAPHRRRPAQGGHSEANVRNVGRRQAQRGGAQRHVPGSARQHRQPHAGTNAHPQRKGHRRQQRRRKADEGEREEGEDAEEAVPTAANPLLQLRGLSFRAPRRDNGPDQHSREP